MDHHQLPVMEEKTPIVERDYSEVIWARHSNPKSGWSRLFSWPIFVIAVYFRKRWLGVVTILFGILNPVLFSEPDEGTDDWMYRIVHAEKRWVDEGNRLIGFTYPQILNTIGLLAMLYGLYAAYKQRPVSTAVGTIAGLGLNQACMKAIIEHYESLDKE